MGNMIQNYANNIGQSISNANNTTKLYYNNITDANSENLLKPLDGKGYLVENNLLTAPKEFARDTYYTAKSLKKGIAGKANDHELGKLNDLGLKIGGLMIASYLMTKRSSLKTKAMEFIGFGTFLASMSIWPKVALQWPAQLIHGVNFRKQYVDEQGRKKYFSQDPNYIPFDLMKGKKKSEDLSAHADRLGISKDDKDRIEIAKEHIRKVSVQNNTLWMMTAGVATPVMTALTCNLLEKPVGILAEKYSNKKINKLAEDIDKYSTENDSKLKTKLIDKNIDKNAKKSLETLLNSKKGNIVTGEDINSIADALTKGLDPQTKAAANRDLTSLINTDKTLVNSDTISDISTNLTKKLDTKYGEGFTSSIIDTKKLSEHINTFMQNNNPENSILNTEKAEELRDSITQFISDSIKDNKSLREARKDMISTMASESVNEIFSTKQVAVLTEDTAKQISKAGGIIREFRAFDESISKATHFKVEKAPETIVGNNWGEVTDILISKLNISDKELQEAKSSEELTAKLFTKKLESLVKDDNKYKEFVQDISKKMAELDVKLDNPTEGKKNIMDILLENTEGNCEKTAKQLNSVADNGSKPFKNLAERFSGKEIDGVFVGSLRESKVQRIKQARIGGVQNAYMRLLHTVDFFKRAAEYESTNTGFSGDKVLDKALIKKGKELLMSSHSGDFYLKSQTANNVSFYKALMWHTFRSGAMSSATAEALNTPSHELFTSGAKTTMAQRVANWAKHVGNLMGTNKNDFLPNHLEGNDTFSNLEKTAVEKFNKIACTPDNLLYNALKNKYNSKTWMKVWSTVGAIVLSGTLLSQFAFGKLDNKGAKQV